MSISFSGLGSGLEYSSWIDSLVEIQQQKITKIQAKNTTIQSKVDSVDALKKSYTNLLTSINKLRDCRFSSDSMFSKCKATSSDDKTVTASVAANTPAQNVSVKVLQLATNTTAEASMPISCFINENTKVSTMACGDVKEGTVVFNLDNEKLEISVGKNDTLGDVAQKMKDAATAAGKNLDVTIEDGKFSVSSDSQMAFTTAGTSNLTSLLGLKKNADSTGYTSLTPISVANPDKPLVNADESGIQGITTGTFTIGGATFKIDSKTTMNGLVNQINNSTDSGVNASFDQTTGKLKLTSKTQGELYISVSSDMANGGSNFTDVMGLTQNGSMLMGSQTTGKNALFNVNGQDKEYISNTIPPSVSGVTGLTLTLNKVTDENAETTIKVASDPTELTNAVESLVKNYNEILELTKKYTKITSSEVDGETVYTKGTLSYDSSLSLLTNQIRNATTGVFNEGTDSAFSMLSQLGISTKAAGASLTDDTSALTFDKEAFLKAYNENPDAVKEFLIGDTEGTKTGILGNLSKKVDEALDFEKGYFALTNNTFKSQMQINNDKITRETTRIAAYRKTLERQFQAMDAAMGKLKTQYSDISSILSSSS